MKNTTNNTRTRSAIIADIINFFTENEDLFNSCIEELDSYNGYLGDDRYYSMDELDELYSGQPASEILTRAFFGHDSESWALDSDGDKVYSRFNPCREFFTFNGYGNLVSADYKDYSAQLDHYAIEAMQEARRWIDSISDDKELETLFDELDEAQE